MTEPTVYKVTLTVTQRVDNCFEISVDGCKNVLPVDMLADSACSMTKQVWAIEAAAKKYNAAIKTDENCNRVDSRIELEEVYNWLPKVA